MKNQNLIYMKYVLKLALVVLLFIGCNSESNKNEISSDTTVARKAIAPFQIVSQPAPTARALSALAAVPLETVE